MKHFLILKGLKLNIAMRRQISVKEEFAFFPQFLYDPAYRICG